MTFNVALRLKTRSAVAFAAGEEAQSVSIIPVT